MPTIQVVKAFTFQHEPRTRKTRDPMDVTKEIIEVMPSELQFFDVGIYEVEDHVAEHWYVQAHLKGYQEPSKIPGMAEFQAAQAAQPVTKEDNSSPTEPSQPMPSDARPPRRAPLPPTVRRAEPIAP